MATINLATLLVLLKMDHSGFQQGSDQAKKKTLDLKDAIGAGLVGAIGLATKAAIDFGKASLEEFQTFEKGIREVYTLLPGISENAMGQMQDDILAFSRETGRLTDETVPALYQSLSAGIPESNVFDFMAVASDAALGGAADLTQAVDVLSGAVNTYGETNLSAKEASDVLFTAVRLGKTTFGELSASIANVLPSAQSLGVSFEDVIADITVLTTKNVSTAQATTQLRQAFIEASKSGTGLSDAIKDLTGKSFAELIAEGKSSSEIFQTLRESMPEQEFRDLFGSVEAANAVLLLTGDNAGQAEETLRAMGEAAGATAEAAAMMADSLEHLQDRANTSTEALKIQAGQSLEPLKRAYYETVIAAGDYMNKDLELRNQLLASSSALEEYGYSGESLRKALGALGEGTTLWRDSLVDAETMANRTAIATNLLEEGWRGSADELGKAVLRIEAADNASNDYVNTLEDLNQMAAEQAAAQEEANRAHQEWIDMGGGAVSAATDYSMSLDELRRMGAEAAQVQREELAVAEEEAAAAALEAAAAVKAHNAEMGSFFVAALNASDGAGFFNESLDELGEQFYTVGGRTAEQNEVLGELRDEYDKAAETLRSYESGVKGVGLTEEARAEAIAEQAARMAELEAAMNPLLSITGDMASKNVEATINQEAVNQAIFDAAEAAGGSATELAILGGALGLYSEEATEAALKSALIQEKINMLAAAYVAGDTSVAQMREELAFFINDLDNVTGEMITTAQNADALTSSAGSLGAEIGNVSAAAIDAATNLGNIPNDIPVHISITSNPIPSLPNAPSGGQATKDQAFALGGFTGGSEGDIAGIVHGQEFVFSAPAVRSIGLPALEMLHSQGLQGGGNSGFSMGDVYVTPGSADTPIEYGRATQRSITSAARGLGLRR